jgi:hypothetical protein
MHQQNLPSNLNLPSVAKRPLPQDRVVGSERVRQQPQVRKLPDRRHSVPPWLRSLLVIQQGSMVIFCSVLGLSAIAYSCTVYTQGAWKQQHGQLKRLQLQERQQGVMNENLKHQMAQMAEQPESGLVPPNPELIVTIPGAPQRPAKSPVLDRSAKSIPESKLPVGY